MQFLHRTAYGSVLSVRVLEYEPGTHFSLNSMSTEPNDPEDFSFEYKTVEDEDWIPGCTLSAFEQRLILRTFKEIINEI